jgi:hypothetical protein
MFQRTFFLSNPAGLIKVNLTSTDLRCAISYTSDIIEGGLLLIDDIDRNVGLLIGF